MVEMLSYHLALEWSNPQTEVGITGGSYIPPGSEPVVCSGSVGGRQLRNSIGEEQLGAGEKRKTLSHGRIVSQLYNSQQS